MISKKDDTFQTQLEKENQINVFGNQIAKNDFKGRRPEQLGDNQDNFKSRMKDIKNPNVRINKIHIDRSQF